MCPKVHLTRLRAVHFFRRPKTQNEKRQSPLCLEEEQELLTAHQREHLQRAKRNAKNLPSEWEDKPVSLWKHSEFTRRWIEHKEKFYPIK